MYKQHQAQKPLGLLSKMYHRVSVLGLLDVFGWGFAASLIRLVFAWWPVCPCQVEDVDMVVSYQVISKGTDEGRKWPSQVKYVTLLALSSTNAVRSRCKSSILKKIAHDSGTHSDAYS